MDNICDFHDFPPLQFDFEVDTAWPNPEESPDHVATGIVDRICPTFSSLGQVEQAMPPSNRERLIHQAEVRLKRRSPNRKVLPLEAQKPLNQWILEHSDHPDMTYHEMEVFMNRWRLDRKQLTTALNNRRQRILG
jgi:hypothetical protein